MSFPYAQGQHLKLNSNNIVSKFDEACQYLLENTFTKLGYLRVLQQEPERELHAILHTNDIGQLGLTLDGDEGNPQAIKEVEQFISLRASGNERLLVADIIERFSKRPYGWPDGEILLVLGRLAASSRISFHAAGPSMPLPDAFEYLTNSRKRREVSVQKKRQVTTLVETVETINAAILAEKRQHALARVDEKIAQLQSEIAKSGIETAELSNRLVRPLQLVKADLETETSIANIYMLQTQTADERLNDGVFDLERTILSELERQQKLQQELTKASQAAGSASSAKEDRVHEPAPTLKPGAPPKPVVEVAATSVFNKLGNGLYLEGQSDIDRFIDAFRAELENAVKQDKRIRIR